MLKFKNHNNIVVKPFVKWAGGKTQLLPIIEKYLPKKYNHYFEPFIGGGALLFKIQPKSFYINDLNNELICAYKCFLSKKTFDKLKKMLVHHEQKHNELYFYKIRNLDKEGKLKRLSMEEIAARFIYINKSCFNGLYRVNANGIFNVPSGGKKKIKTFDRKNFDNLYKFFKTRNSHITCLDFEKALEKVKKDDFVYFDPPYDILNDKTFTKYQAVGFGVKEQIRLANVYKKLDERGIKIMLSNHDTPLIRKLYKKYKIIVVKARRCINSVGSKRGKINELLIINY